MWAYRGTPYQYISHLLILVTVRIDGRKTHTFSAAPALATARETPRIALAPSLPLLAVPSSELRKLSTLDWSLTSRFSAIRAGPRTVLTLATAWLTPLPAHLALSPSRSSTASCWPVTIGYNSNSAEGRGRARDEPVEAPEGTMARCKPVSVTISTSTVGLPRES